MISLAAICTMKWNNKLVNIDPVFYPGHDEVLLGVILSQVFPAGHTIRLCGLPARNDPGSLTQISARDVSR